MKAGIRSGLAAAATLAALAGVALGGGGGGNLEISKYAVGKSPLGVAIGDFNRDGRKDVVVVNFQRADDSPTTPHTLSVLRGRAGGKFRRARTVNLDPDDQPDGIQIVRLGQGKDLDLVVGTLDDEILLLTGKKGIGFRPPVDLAIGESPREVATGDFNQDGRLDIAASRQDTGDVAVLLGLGGLDFGPPALHPIGGAGGGPLLAANLDPGGDLDLLTVNYTTGSLALLRGQAGGGFSAPSPLDPPSPPTSIEVVDLNRDGRRDVVVGLFGDRPRLTVFRGLAGGTFAAPQTLALAGRAMLVRDIAVTKLNGDRDRDLVISGVEVGGVRVARGDPGPPPKGRVLFLEGRAGIRLKRVREVDFVGSSEAVAAGRLDRTKPLDAVATRQREQRGQAVVILNP